ncbi:MAG: UPF0042 nucleotide-binding protein [Candidatus Azotimanducaceae bacterium]|jgi:UPF0042 nucleotide-binding protein
MISLIILSGRSGSGKSTALHVLEDLGYYCIDNLPASLLKPLITRLSTNNKLTKVSVSIDARNIAEDLANFPQEIENLKDVDLQIVYLDSNSPTLVKRFSETRRKHPLSNKDVDLRAALELETVLLDSISDIADLTIDTTDLTIHELRDLISTRITGDKQGLALLFLSFGFKNGVPVDVDLVFDIRCLPNPHWVTSLRALTGLDSPVQEFLGGHQDVEEMYQDIQSYLEKWLPKFVDTNRSYMTIGIGCTGGQHRSVYMTERLFNGFREKYENIQVRHRELGKLPRD